MKVPNYIRKAVTPLIIAGYLLSQSSGYKAKAESGYENQKPIAVVAQNYDGIEPSFPEKVYSQDQIEAFKLAASMDAGESEDAALQPGYIQENLQPIATKVENKISKPTKVETPKQTSQFCDGNHYRHPGRNGYTVSDGPTYTDSKGEYFFVEENDINKMYETISEENPDVKEVYFEIKGESLNYNGGNNLEGILKSKDRCYKVPIVNGSATFKNVPKNLVDYKVAIASGDEILASYKNLSTAPEKNQTNRDRASDNGSSALPPTIPSDETGTGSTGQGTTQDNSKFPVYCAENCSEPIKALSSSYGKTKANVGNWVVLKPVDPNYKILKEMPMAHTSMDHSQSNNSILLRAHQPEKASVRIEYSDSGKLKSATVGLEFLMGSENPDSKITEEDLTKSNSNKPYAFNAEVFTQWLSGKPQNCTEDIQKRYAQGKTSTISVNEDHKFWVRTKNENGYTPYLVKVNSPELAAQIRTGKINYNQVKKGDFSPVRLHQIFGNYYEINLEGKTSLEDKVTNASFGTTKYTYAKGDLLNHIKIRMPHYIQRDGVEKEEENLYLGYIVGRDANGNLDVKIISFFEAVTNTPKTALKWFTIGAAATAGATYGITVATMPLEKALELAVSQGTLDGGVVGAGEAGELAGGLVGLF
ncbi:MAG: hypothetical protein PHD81_00120 [Candidatus Nanoarchaeia archaeon]|nr:hypothetical protein [Candidatus Nanoarchaeia archaeon]MDD5587497.1 hypothetical protein [Candidatus Nanoarchaeia archaeon]